MTPRALWIGLLLLLTLSPLPLGSNRPLAWSALGLSAGLLLLGWAWLVHRRQLRIFWRPALWMPVIALALVLVWIVVQAGVFTLPGANPLWNLAAEALGAELDPSVGLVPDAAISGLAKLLAYVAVFWLALQLGRDPDRAWQLVRWFTWGSAAYAIYGLANYFAGNRLLLWYERWAYHDDLTATFVNRNHYATMAAFGILAATALAIRAFKTKWRLADRSLPPLHRFTEGLIGSSLIYVIVTVVIAMAWLQTHSRLGFAAGAMGMAVLLVLLRTSGTIRGRATLAATILLPIFLIAVSGRGTMARLDATQAFDRTALFSLVSAAVESSPWAGYGYGSFPLVFQMFRDPTVPPGLEYTEAHSSYLELAFELGIGGAGAMVAGLIWIVAINIRGTYRRRRESMIPAMAVAAATVVAIHSLADFSLQIPAVALTFAAILGVGTAQSWSGQDA